LEADTVGNNMEALVDECLTFFFGATQTLSSTLFNILLCSVKFPQIKTKLREELNNKVIGSNIELLNDPNFIISSQLNYDLLQELSYLTMVMNESFRISAPVFFGQLHCFKENVTLGGYNINQGDAFVVDFNALHNNPNEWISTDQFIPERFDPRSEYSLTPAGNKR
jgi:cytochrome P450